MLTRALAVVLALVAALPTVAVAAPAWDEIAAPSAIVIDAETGEVLFAREPDAVRPIASLTKLFVALALRRRGLDLDAWSEITPADARAAEGGAPTSLLRGEVFRHRDLLHAMLLVSDNRVPTALARSVGLSRDQLVDALNALARTLGLPRTQFVDATGILGNLSTARELAQAMRRALADPVLAPILRTRYARALSRSAAVDARYRSTVRPLWRKAWTVRGGKTGHTEAAGYCIVLGARHGTRELVMAFLGSAAESDRLADVARVLDAAPAYRVPTAVFADSAGETSTGDSVANVPDGAYVRK